MNQRIVITLVIGFLGIVIPGYFLINATPTGDVVVASEPTSEAEARFVDLTNQLDQLQFDKSILSDPRFSALIDLHTAVLPETLGKRDPFAPFGK